MQLNCPRILHITIVWIVIFLSQAIITNAQIVSVDTLTAKPNTNFPFDIGFPLKYSVSNGIKVSRGVLFKVDRQGCKANILSKKCIVEKNKKNIEIFEARKRASSDPEEIKQLQEQINSLLEGKGVYGQDIAVIKQIGNDVYLDMPALEANTGYRIYLYDKPEKVDGIKEVFQDFEDNKMTAAESAYSKISKRYERSFASDIIKCSNCGTDKFGAPTLESFLAIYQDQLKSKWELFNIENKKLEDLKKREPAIDKPKFHYFGGFDGILKDFIAFTESCVICKDSVLKNKLLNDRKIDILSAFTNLQYLAAVEVHQGYSSIYNYRTIIDSKADLDQRIKNVSGSILGLESISILTDYYLLKYKYVDVNLPAFKKFLLEGISDYQQNLKLLQDHQKTIKDQQTVVTPLENDLNASTGLVFSSPISGISSDTYTYNFITRAGYHIKTDFGFMLYGNPWNNPSLKGFLPYIGFHVNLRPMNTDIPFGKIPNKDIFSYLSLNAGAVIGSLGEDGKREGLIGSTSIYTGLGINFVHEFRFVFGGVWYRKLDPNPLNNNKTAAVTPFVGLSLDFRLEDIYKGFKKIFEP